MDYSLGAASLAIVGYSYHRFDLAARRPVVDGECHFRALNAGSAQSTDAGKSWKTLVFW